MGTTPLGKSCHWRGSELDTCANGRGPKKCNIPLQGLKQEANQIKKMDRNGVGEEASYLSLTVLRLVTWICRNRHLKIAHQKLQCHSQRVKVKSNFCFKYFTYFIAFLTLNRL